VFPARGTDPAAGYDAAVAQAETTATSGSQPAREILTWELFGTASRELAAQVAADGYRPEVVLAIARGGLLPAGALAYALDLKNVATVNVEFYTGVDQRLPVPVMLPPVPEAVDLAGARVLIVDDVADTGRTLEVVQKFAGAHVAESRTAVLYEKPHSVVRCEYVWRRTDRWINFPWSTLPPVVRSDGTVLDA
jgi:hypoxanthine phosphoribosyltransferase